MIKTFNPSTGELLKTYEELDQNQIDVRLENATRAFESWKNTDLQVRKDLMLKLVDMLEKEKDLLAKMMTEEMGKIISESFSEIEKCILAIKYYVLNIEK